MQEFLRDKKNGKKVNWVKYKIDSLNLAASYLRIGLGFENKGYRVYSCGTYLEFKEYLNGELKLNKADFCKVRLCPMCSFRRSKKIFGQVSKVMDYLTINHDYKYLFLTLTVKNVEGSLLSSEIDNLFKGFNSMTKRKEFKKLSKGWFRCLEVTHNWERGDYHPHFHVVIAVSNSYFGGSGGYLSQKKWTELWKSCLNVDYNPIVDIRKVKSKLGKNDYSKAVAEVAKYTVKASDYLYNIDGKVIAEMTDPVVTILDLALHNRRLVAFGGQFKEVHKKLTLDDCENGNLIHTDNENDIRNDLEYVIVRYNWNVGFQNYIIHKD